MAIIRAYTTIEQSRKLEEILPIESADMRYQAHYDNKNNLKYIPRFISTIIPLRVDIPCWSLAALLSVLPPFAIDSSDDNYFRIHCQQKFSEWHNNLIDACYEMIIKIHDLNLL